MALDSCKIWSETDFNCGLKRLPFLSSKQQAQNAQNSPLVPVFLFCHFQGRLANTLHYFHQHKPTKEWKSSGILSKVMEIHGIMPNYTIKLEYFNAAVDDFMTETFLNQPRPVD